MPAALRAGVEQLAGFYGPPRGFSFPREIQPILDRHCIRCHFVFIRNRRRPAARKSVDGLQGDVPTVNEPAFSLLAREVVDPVAKRRWSESYLALTQSKPASIVGGPVVSSGIRTTW